MAVSEKKTTALTTKKLLLFGLILLFVVLTAAGLWYVKVSDVSTKSILPPCLFHELTGLYCTGCGMTRALHYIMNGQLYQGFRMNPLAVASMPFLVGFMILLFYRLYKGKPLPSMPTWLPWAILAIIVVYTVARNLPWEPFSWLAPTQLSWVRK